MFHNYNELFTLEPSPQPLEIQIPMIQSCLSIGGRVVTITGAGGPSSMSAGVAKEKKKT